VRWKPHVPASAAASASACAASSTASDDNAYAVFADAAVFRLAGNQVAECADAVVADTAAQIIQVEGQLRGPQLGRTDLADLLRTVQELERSKLRLTLSWHARATNFNCTLSCTVHYCVACCIMRPYSHTHTHTQSSCQQQPASLHTEVAVL
jgi:DNA repair REX1-B